MKVLMLIPPYIAGFMRNARWDGITISGTNWYPVFMAYATGLLEKNGHEVKLLDAQVERLSREQVLQIAKDFKPELTATYFSMKCVDNDLGITQQVCDETGSDSILVGHSTSLATYDILKKYTLVSKMTKGEFDFTLLDVANKKQLKEINGLVYKDDKFIVENEPRQPITSAQLEIYPFVSSIYKKHLKMNKYYLSGHIAPYIDLFTGRGCVYGVCTFCHWAYNMYGGVGNRYRTRPMKSVIEEIRYIKSELPEIKDIFIQDDNFPKERAIELSELLLENHIKIRWSAYCRADRDYETLKLMHKAGCYLLETGFESSSQEILNNIKKGITVKQMEKYAYDAHKAGIAVIGAFITGLPGETVETIKATTEWISKMPILRYTITLPKPYKGTAFYDWLVKHDCLKDGKPNYPELSTEDIYYWNKWSLKHSYLNTRFIGKMLVRPYDWGRVIKGAYYFLPYILGKEKQNTVELEW